MDCTYTPLSGHSVQKAFWTKELVTSGSEPPDLLDDPEYRGRVQYLGDERRDCTLRFRNVREKDQSKYYFTFITDRPGGKYQGAGGVDLSVTDLQVEVPERVIEGGDVTLTCKTTCSLTVRPTFTWYRNGRNLSSSTDQLHLQPVSRDDAGRYHCAVLGLSSPEAPLNVRYLQVEVPERVIEGRDVTLTCKTSVSLSDSPTFTWYRNGHNLSSSTDQLHLQPVSREDAGSYCCAVLGQNLRSPEVPLNVRYGPKSISVSVSPSGELVEGSSVNLTCSSDANPPVQNYTWLKGTSVVAEGETYTMKKISSVDSGEYKCRSSNEHGEKLSAALTLNVLYPPKSVSVSISPSGEISEGSSVNLTCSSDANPPVKNYTWFKEGGSSPVGSGHGYRALQSGSYYCVALNEHGSRTSAAVTVREKGVSGAGKHLQQLWEIQLQKRRMFGIMLAEQNFWACLEQSSLHSLPLSPLLSLDSSPELSIHPLPLSLSVLPFLHLNGEGVCLHTEQRFVTVKENHKSTGNQYSNLGAELEATSSDATPGPDPSNEDDVHYASVVAHKVRNPRNAESSTATASGTDEVQYASIQHRRDEVVQKTEEDDVQYASVRFTRTGAANRPVVDDASVIYSTMK
ncbi:hypothetical protein AOLI_G00235460 [Acnodon oligacanthus]